MNWNGWIEKTHSERQGRDDCIPARIPGNQRYTSDRPARFGLKTTKIVDLELPMAFRCFSISAAMEWPSRPFTASLAISSEMPHPSHVFYSTEHGRVSQPVVTSLPAGKGPLWYVVLYFSFISCLSLVLTNSNRTLLKSNYYFALVLYLY